MRLALALVLLAPPTLAASRFAVGAGPKAEERLRRFIADDKVLKARLDDASARERQFRAEIAESGLKDAVGDTVLDPKERIAEMPGMRMPPAPTCPTLADCGSPDLSAVVAEPALLPDAVRGLVRPWLLLQEARGAKAVIASASRGDALMTVTLKGLDTAPLVLNVSPRLLGGFNVWFDEPARLSELYERERAAALARR